ncbi:NAD-P-binding protein [Mycena sanguinolenta]|nr:NAD-P-binding protein [Mycena sanguinolenta]
MYNKETKVSYITGAASGISRALATMLSATFSKRAGGHRRSQAGSKSASELNEKAGSIVALSVKIDTTVWEDQLAAFQQAKSTFKRIDYVFANAGIAEHPWLPPFDPETAPLRPIEVGASGFRGKLILTASVFAYYPSRAMPLYAASKAGVINFMRSAAQYYAAKDIIINAIAPNLVDTPIAPDVLFAPFRERKLLSDVELVLEQFQKCLGESTINGQALSICQDKIWVHPPDTHMFEENDPACELISVQLFKLFGDNTL